MQSEIVVHCPDCGANEAHVRPCKRLPIGYRRFNNPCRGLINIKQGKQYLQNANHAPKGWTDDTRAIAYAQEHHRQGLRFDQEVVQ